MTERAKTPTTKNRGSEKERDSQPFSLLSIGRNFVPARFVWTKKRPQATVNTLKGG